MSRVTGILLAGGKSTRMGKDKAFIPFMGKNLMMHNLSLLRGMCHEVLMSANQPVFENFGIRVIKDIYPDAGPIGGMHACLRESSFQYSIILSCDLPFINQGLLFGLFAHINEGYDIIAYQCNNQVEPLFACYSKNVLPQIEKNITQKDFKLQNIFKQLKVKLIPLHSKIFSTNLNTVSDIFNSQNRFRWKLPNMIIVSGDGRNVGKTFFTCSVIKHFSRQQQIVAVKTSSHFHDTFNQSQVIKESHNYKIIKETGITQKDSSLMLQAGAHEAFFIMADKNGLAPAFEQLVYGLKDKIIIVESGALCDVALPGFFFFIKQKNRQINKPTYLKYQPVLVNNSSKGFDFNIKNLDYRDNHVIYKL